MFHRPRRSPSTPLSRRPWRSWLILAALAAPIAVSAADKGIPALDTPITMSFANTSTATALRQMAAMAGFQIDLKLPNDGKDLPAITFNASDMATRDALDMVCRMARLEWTVDGKRVIVQAASGKGPRPAR